METIAILEMKKGQCYFFTFLLFFTISSSTVFSVTTPSTSSSSFGVKKSDFPPDFVFGAGTAAPQVEGAAFDDGKKPSIWDPFTHSGMTMDSSNGDIAADQYHKYKEDVKLMHDMGLDAYRFSISWSRLIPDGNGPVNPKGLQYYNNLIDELVSHGIEPHVTLYHFDLPLAVQEEYEGLLSPRIIEDYTAYANVCFKEFGDRVKNWITFNEPNLEPIGGYNDGSYPPQRCSNPFGVFNCSKGDSTKEPYIVAHHILLSHLSASMLYKEKYKASQGGIIGITIAAPWFEPFTNSQKDIGATYRVLDFQIGWIIDPLIYGDYPTIMKERVGARLPSFNFEESKRLKNSFDFIGVTHYTAFQVQNKQNNLKNSDRDYMRDMAASVPGCFNGGKTTVSAMGNMPSSNTSTTPWTLVKMLNYLKVKYKNPPIVIHENGFGEYGIIPNTDGTNDEGRVKYLQEYIKAALQSVRNGSNISGYFVWSLLDCFELRHGYTARFGLIGVDYSRKDRRRYPKLSADWYAEFLNGDQLRTHASNDMNIM